MLKTCSIGKTVLSVSCARFKSHICKLRPPPPTLRPRNPCICPCLSRRRRSTQISRLCPFSSRRQAEWSWSTAIGGPKMSGNFVRERQRIVRWPTTANATQCLLNTTTYFVKHDSRFTKHNKRLTNHNNKFTKTHH